MKRYAAWGCLAFLALTLPLMAGCQTFTQTPGENAVTVEHAMNTNMLQIPDDAEHIMLLDRPLGLSEVPIQQ